MRDRKIKYRLLVLTICALAPTLAPTMFAAEGIGQDDAQATADSTRPARAGGTASPKTMAIPLSPSALNDLIFRPDGCNVPIDILLQDDTEVDYVKLRVWTY